MTEVTFLSQQCCLIGVLYRTLKIIIMMISIMAYEWGAWLNTDWQGNENTRGRGVPERVCPPQTPPPHH